MILQAIDPIASDAKDSMAPTPCRRLRVAAQLIERSAYDFAGVVDSAFCARLILMAHELVQMTEKSACREVPPEV